MNRAESLMRVSSVTSDDAHGMRLAIQHLHSLGHRRIGHLAGPQHLSTGFLRSNGFRDAVAALGMDPADTPIVECAALYPSRRRGRHASAARAVAPA